MFFLQAKGAAGAQEGTEGASSKSGTTSADESPRNGKVPEGNEKPSFSGRTESGQGSGASYKEGSRAGLSTRLWNAYSFVRREVSKDLTRHVTADYATSGLRLADGTPSLMEQETYTGALPFRPFPATIALCVSERVLCQQCTLKLHTRPMLCFQTACRGTFQGLLDTVV